MINADAALTYLEFVHERHAVWQARQRGEPQEFWTEDPVLATRKFTNVFRILDPGSQFILTDLYDSEGDPADNLMRFFLYRHTGRIEAWDYLLTMLGQFTVADLDDVFKAWQDYRGTGVTKTKKQEPYADRLARTGDHHSPRGFQSTTYERPMFTGAYLVFPQSQVPGTDKLESIIDLTKRLFQTGLAGREFLLRKTQADRFGCLRMNKGVADFMSMQILTDWGYTTEDRENEFVVAGPGAVKGAKLIDPTASAEAMIRWAQPQLANLRLHGRSPSLMDVQNTLCEFSKYARFAAKPDAVRAWYQPAHPGPQPEPVLPPKWSFA